MGTVNYCTSEYITMGIVPYSALDMEKDEDFMEQVKQKSKEWDVSIDEVIDDYIQTCYEDDFLNIKSELENYEFYYFHVEIRSGYYEGFSIYIEDNFPIALDDWHEKREANKEITQIKKFLIECANFGMVACYPGWCTGYEDHKDTLDLIDVAIREMRDKVNATPTWRQYYRNCGE